MEACELERLNAGGGADSLESILLILRQRGRDFLERDRDENKNTLSFCHANLYHTDKARTRASTVTVPASRERDVGGQVHSSGGLHDLCCS